MAIDDSNSNIDTSNALFNIEVPSKNNTNSYSSLFLISDTNCLIQSNNYTTGKYTWGVDGGETQAAGDGMRIDLSYGTIDAYKLKISSSNILINSSGDTDPLFVVRASIGDNKYKNLLYIKDIRDDSGQEENTQFYIRSKTYEEDSNGKQTAGM
jgi:hypothetical protein